MSERPLWRGAAVLLILAAGGVLLYLSPLGQRLDVATLVAWARTHGDAPWALPAYFGAYILLAVLFVPTQPLSIAAVIIWGWWRGGLVELVAATAGAILPYLICRSSLREPIVARVKKYRLASQVLDRESFMLLLVLRIVPILPYPVLNYVAGLTSLRLWQYLAATVIGMIPSIFIFAYFFEALMEGMMRPRQVVGRAIIAGALLIVLIVATRLAAPRLRRRLER